MPVSSGNSTDDSSGQLVHSLSNVYEPAVAVAYDTDDSLGKATSWNSLPFAAYEKAYWPPIVVNSVNSSRLLWCGL